MYVVGSNMSNVNLTVKTGILLNSFFGKDRQPVVRDKNTKGHKIKNPFIDLIVLGRERIG